MTVNKNMNILVVEDNNTMRRIVRDLVKQLGFNNCDEAIDGKSGLDKLYGKTPFDFIISDWHMEPMTGLELLQKVRADELAHGFAPLPADYSPVLTFVQENYERVGETQFYEIYK